jgi:hypothetical protein
MCMLLAEDSWHQDYMGTFWCHMPFNKQYGRVNAVRSCVTSYPTTGEDRPLGSRRMRLPEFLHIWHMKVGRVSALHNGRLYPPGENNWYSFLSEAEFTTGPVQLEGESQWEIPMTPSEIEPATFWLLPESTAPHIPPPPQVGLQDISNYRARFPKLYSRKSIAPKRDSTNTMLQNVPPPSYRNWYQRVFSFLEKLRKLCGFNDSNA